MSELQPSRIWIFQRESYWCYSEEDAGYSMLLCILYVCVYCIAYIACYYLSYLEEFECRNAFVTSVSPCRCLCSTRLCVVWRGCSPSACPSPWQCASVWGRVVCCCWRPAGWTCCCACVSMSARTTCSTPSRPTDRPHAAPLPVAQTWSQAQISWDWTNALCDLKGKRTVITDLQKTYPPDLTLVLHSSLSTDSYT